MKHQLKTVFIKIGTEALQAAQGAPNFKVMQRVASDVACLKREGIQVMIVSSGAVGTGRGIVSKEELACFDDVILRKQILAAHGQTKLTEMWNAALQEFGLRAAQVLLTKMGLTNETGGDCAKRMIIGTLGMRNSVIIANENDSVAVDELKFGDNDTLSGHTIEMLDLPGENVFIILSHIKGVYTRDPRLAGAVLIEHIYPDREKPEIDTRGTSDGGSGGMTSRLEVGYKMAAIGVTTHIAPIEEENVILRLIRGESIGTTIHPARHKPALFSLA